VRYLIGLDIGGTNLVTGAVAEDGSRLLALKSEPTRPEEGPDAVLRRLAGQARATLAETRTADPAAEITGVGVGAPGPLDTRAGIIFLTPNLGWENLPLRQQVADVLGLPATLDNDANCAVLGEWWRGAARGTRNAIGFTIGTGIGGGIIVDGPRAGAATAATTGASRPTPRGRPSRCAPSRRSRPGPRVSSGPWWTATSAG
jgi:glucokinase